MKRLDLTSILNRISNALSKGVSNMDVIGVLTAIWIACWVATYAPDFNKEQPKEQTEKVNGNTTNTQK
jgi:hypothetical protein